MIVDVSRVSGTLISQIVGKSYSLPNKISLNWSYGCSGIEEIAWSNKSIELHIAYVV